MEVAGLAAGGSFRIPATVAVGCTAILIVAWSYVLAGALHAHGALRLIALAVYSLAMALTFLLVLPPSAFRRPLTYVLLDIPLLLLLALWNLSAIRWIQDRFLFRDQPHRTHHHHLHRSTFRIALGVTAASYLPPGAGDGGRQPSFARRELAAQRAALRPDPCPVAGRQRLRRGVR